MGFLDRFRFRREPQMVRVHDSDRVTRFGGGRTKYGNIRYTEASRVDYAQQRENARGVYEESLVARGLVNRLVDNVINAGLTLECAPMWPLLKEFKDVDWGDEQRRDWTSRVEGLWKLWSQSSESDYRGRLTFGQLQRLLYRLLPKEGEHFIICHYNEDRKIDRNRTNPLSLQILDNAQVIQPYDARITHQAEERGASIEAGIEYASDGRMSAIYVNEEKLGVFPSKAKRIPVWDDKGRRNVIHSVNMEYPEQARGYPELAAFIYELDRLTEYDISELEAVIAGSLWFAAIETEKGGSGRAMFGPASGLGASADESASSGDGIREMPMGKRALLLQNLGPGQKFKGFQPNRPNPNFSSFEEVFEGRIAGSIGMPLSVFRQRFQSSYSASRAEILFFWNTVQRRRADFIDGTLNPIFEAWFSEHVKSKDINAPGFVDEGDKGNEGGKGNEAGNRPIIRRAWLSVTWNGISRPVVDPRKEADAVGLRQKMGHTTGEREARAYNGSDFMMNAQRLKAENREIAEANRPLEASGGVQSAPEEEGTSDNDEEV